MWALAATHRIEDGGFFEAVGAYLRTSNPPPVGGADEANTRLFEEHLRLFDERAVLHAQIEAATVTFLTNIGRRLADVPRPRELPAPRSVAVQAAQPPGEPP